MYKILRFYLFDLLKNDVNKAFSFDFIYSM